MSKELPRVSVGAVMMLMRGEQVLLLKRSADESYEPGSYTLPSGTKEAHESVLQAAIRETAEEVGIIVDPQDTTWVHTMSRKKPDGEEWIDVFFIANQWEGEPSVMEPEQCDSVGWFEVNDLPEKTIPFIKQAMVHVRENVLYSEFGY